MTNVSVLCTERGGLECHRCLSLAPHLQCGWCFITQTCTFKHQCPLADQLMGWQDLRTGCFELNYLTHSTPTSQLVLLLSMVLSILLILLFVLLIVHLGGSRERTLRHSWFSSILQALCRSKTQSLDDNSPSSNVVRRTKAHWDASVDHNDNSPPEALSGNWLRSLDKSSHQPSMYAAINKKTNRRHVLSRLSRISMIWSPDPQNLVATPSLATPPGLITSGLVTPSSTFSHFERTQEEQESSEETLYMAASTPLSCQTSVVPVSRHQFYVVVQINTQQSSS